MSLNEIVNVLELLFSKNDLLQTYLLDLTLFTKKVSLDSIKRSIATLVWKVMKSIPLYFTSMFLVCDINCVKSIKERVS